MRYYKIYALFIVWMSVLSVFSQDDSPSTGDLTSKIIGSDRLNSIQTTVPFLTIAPDSRAGAMGDVGAATTPDAQSMHWNPAKYAFIDGELGGSFSYTPWLNDLADDINLLYLAGYYRLDDRQVIGATLRYFSLGSITFYDDFANFQGERTPNEWSVDGAYSRLFSEKISGSLAMRFIYSNITGGGAFGNEEYKAGWSVAADLSMYYETPLLIDERDAELAFGFNIADMGRKISYTEGQEADFIPINMKLGGRLTLDVDEYNSFAIAIDVNKLLVPSPPVYAIDNPDSIIAGEDPDVAVPLGMVRSFYDAPGGYKEELHELMFSFGLEYWYRDQFAIRGGYFNEHNTKGGRKFFTAGIGLSLNVIFMDFSYIFQSRRTNPLANTMRFTLGVKIDKFRDFRK